MEVDTITREVVTDTRLQTAFERLIEIKHQKTLLEAEEQLIKDDAFDYLTGVEHTTCGRFVVNNITAEVYVSYRPQREWKTGELQKVKNLEGHLGHAECFVVAYCVSLSNENEREQSELSSTELRLYSCELLLLGQGLLFMLGIPSQFHKVL